MSPISSASLRISPKISSRVTPSARSVPSTRRRWTTLKVTVL